MGSDSSVLDNAVNLAFKAQMQKENKAKPLPPGFASLMENWLCLENSAGGALPGFPYQMAAKQEHRLLPV